MLDSSAICPADPLTQTGTTPQQLSRLKAMTYAELAELDAFSSEKIGDHRRSQTLSIWKDKFDDEKVQVVVQLYKPWFMGIGKMRAQGFCVDRSGKIRDLHSEDLYDYMGCRPSGQHFIKPAVRPYQSSH